MKNLIKKVALLTVTGVVMFSANAQEEKGVKFNVSGDLVSSYIWRGAYNAGASVQPTLGMSAGNFSFTAWGSKEISGPHKEIDLTAAYNFGRVSLLVTDYWWAGEKYGNDNAMETNNKYFHFDNHNTAHRVEAGLVYTVSEKVPLSISWNTMFWGADKKANGKQNYSSYVELNYPFSIKSINLTATMGLTPYESQTMYATSGFAVCNLALGASKEIQITKSFSLPVFTKVIFDPAHEDAHIVFGFTLR